MTSGFSLHRVALLFPGTEKSVCAAGDQPGDKGQQHWPTEASPGPLLEFCAQHPGAAGEQGRQLGERHQPACCFPGKVTPAGEAPPGSCMPWECSCGIGPGSCGSGTGAWQWERSSCSLAGCAEEKRICSQQPGLVFIDRINGWHRFQSGSLCSWCWSHSADGVWAVRVLWKWL